ncbi:hypothetical protein ACMGB6_000997 [Klebsiella oxytoca]
MTSKLTKERIEWLNYAATGLAANGTEMAMSPQDVIALTECCLAAMDSEPVVYASEETLAYAAHGELLLRVLSQPAGDAIIPLYRHAQQPVVPDEITSASAPEVFEIAAEAERLGLRGTYASYAVGWNACRATMLQAGNSPVIPDGYVMVPKEPTEAMINAWLSEVANWRGHVAGYKAMLAAAPQEVK